MKEKVYNNNNDNNNIGLLQQVASSSCLSLYDEVDKLSLFTYKSSK